MSAGQPGLSQAILAVQAEAPTLPKDGRNPAFGGSKYTTLATIVEKIGPILNNHGLIWLTLPCRDETGEPALNYRLIHAASGETLDGTMPLMLSKADAQGMGSALTYSRRYSLCAVLNLVADDDDDGNSAAAQSGSTGTVLATEPQLKLLRKLHKQNNPPERTMRAMLDHVGAQDVEYAAGWAAKLSKSQASALIEVFKSGSLPDPEAQDIPTDLDPDDNAAKPLAEQLGDTSDLPFDVAAPGETVRHTEEDLRRAAGIAKRHPVDAASTATSGEGDEHA